MRAHPSPDLQFNVILGFSNETSVFFAASSTLKFIILSPTTPKVVKALLECFLQSAISKLPIMTLTSACDDLAMTITVMMMMEAMKMTVMVMIMFVTMTVMMMMMMMISQFD